MASLIPGYNYDIFISYRQKDNKHDGWVTEFVDNLKGELESTFKEEISVYFDINPHDGLLETHDVDASLKDKLRCLVFIPIISQTYCDSKSFAWQHEFCAFNKLAKEDKFGRDIKFSSGNVASRIMPIKIHDLDPEDKALLETEIGGVLRSIEFIYKSAGVNRPLRANEDHPHDNLNKTYFRDQINKVANAVKEIITTIKKHDQNELKVSKEVIRVNPERSKYRKVRFIIASITVLALIVLGYFFIPKLSNSSQSVEKSIAVLPFRNESPNDSITYFIDGVMEEILSDLQTIKDIRVISRTSVEQYRKQTKSIPEIAKELGVNYIMEGSGQKSGNKFRLRIQLIRASKEGHLWAKSYEQENPSAKEYFSIQSQIAQAIATQLEAAITSKEKQLIEKIPTVNLKAYDAYLKGDFYLNKATSNDLDTAMHYFELAKEIDTNYALTYTGIFEVLEQRAQFSTVSPEEAIPKEMAALAKAIELDSTRAEVYFSLALIKFNIRWDWKGGESAYKKALALNPNYAVAQSFYSTYLLILGRMKEALKLGKMALKLDPLSTPCKVNYGLDLLFARRYNEAIKTFREVLKTDPGNYLALGNLQIAFHQIGRYTEELEAWESYYNCVYKNFVNVFDQGYVKGGYVGAMNLEADTLVAQSKTNYINPCEIAAIYACAGNKRRAIDMLERAYEVHDPNTPFLLYPVYDNLRNESRFQELARKMNVPYK